MNSETVSFIAEGAEAQRRRDFMCSSYYLNCFSVRLRVFATSVFNNVLIISAKTQRRRGVMCLDDYLNYLPPRLRAFAFSAFNNVISTEALHD